MVSLKFILFGIHWGSLIFIFYPVWRLFWSLCLRIFFCPNNHSWKPLTDARLWDIMAWGFLSEISFIPFFFFLLIYSPGLLIVSSVISILKPIREILFHLHFSFKIFFFLSFSAENYLFIISSLFFFILWNLVIIAALKFLSDYFNNGDFDSFNTVGHCGLGSC